MNKKELTAVVVLFALLISWGFLQRKLMPPRPPVPQVVEEAATVTPSEETFLTKAAETNRVVNVVDTPAPVVAPVEGVAATAAVDVDGDVEHAEPESVVIISNQVVSVAVSSWGAVIKHVDLVNFPETIDEGSGPVHLDFSESPALSLTGIPGLTAANDYRLVVSGDGNAVVLSRKTPGGITFERTIRLEDGYRLLIADTTSNDGPAALSVPEHSVSIGPMRTIQSNAKVRSISYLGVDTLAVHGGDKVMHWGRKRMPSLFGHKASPLSCARSDLGNMAIDVRHRVGQPLTWMGIKNKFFVQLLAPDVESADGEICAARDMESRSFALSTVRGSLIFAPAVLEPGESRTREMSYFVGPKKYALLKTLGQHQSNIMEFGWFAWLCKPLLYILNRIYALIPNYGIAIILLTALVRVVFWPVTHKSTESMKKMQKIQPLVNEVREKHKGNAQKMNQEVMALYKEHKVNPMGGCLPMVIQIPVFIALFTVLRSAVELRFAGFLWIRDLSEPEGLLSGMIPVVGSLNILPLFMTATMVLQQRLTPTAGDPQQQKMMMFMPLVMLFIFYSMPSALVLYWSTSQCLAIVQLLMQRRKTAAEDAG